MTETSSEKPRESSVTEPQKQPRQTCHRMRSLSRDKRPSRSVNVVPRRDPRDQLAVEQHCRAALQIRKNVRRNDHLRRHRAGLVRSGRRALGGPIGVGGRGVVGMVIRLREAYSEPLARPPARGRSCSIRGSHSCIAGIASTGARRSAARPQRRRLRWLSAGGCMRLHEALARPAPRATPRQGAEPRFARGIRPCRRATPIP